jgi:hypothetical protein
MKLRERFLPDVEATPAHLRWPSEPGVHDGILDCRERESVTFRGLITIGKNRGLRVTVSR